MFSTARRLFSRHWASFVILIVATGCVNTDHAMKTTASAAVSSTVFGSLGVAEDAICIMVEPVDAESACVYVLRTPDDRLRYSHDRAALSPYLASVGMHALGAVLRDLVASDTRAVVVTTADLWRHAASSDTALIPQDRVIIISM